MQAVITEKQARKITGGRKPLVPVEYESAIRSLQLCASLDDAKYWSDKADALAAWARIYRNDEAGTEARKLKLHAYRRMGDLARDIAKANVNSKDTAIRRSSRAVLMGSGLKGYQARAAQTTSAMPEQRFNEVVNLPKPPSPASLRAYAEGRTCSEAWAILSGKYLGSNNSLTGFKAFCSRNVAKDLARRLTADEAQKALRVVNEVTDWLDEFEQYLPQSKT